VVSVGIACLLIHLPQAVLNELALKPEDITTDAVKEVIGNKGRVVLYIAVTTMIWSGAAFAAIVAISNVAVMNNILLRIHV